MTSVPEPPQARPPGVDLEGLTRPLLEQLHDLSGIASTYLTVVDEEAGEQLIRFSRNAKDGFALPEGLRVPWEDTLCKRALDEGRSCTTDVPAVWGDSAAAAALGIVTYVSVPVRLSDGRLWGTLCGADDVAHDDAADHLTTLGLFAELIAAEVERSAPVVPAPRTAETDPLTGCAAAAAVGPWLQAAVPGPGQVLALVGLDVDGFGQVNAGVGRSAGDALLAELGERLRGAAREGDLVARTGGDELLVAAVLPRRDVPGLLARARAAGRFAVAVPGGPLQVRCATGLATSDDVPADGLLAAVAAAVRQDKPLAR